MKKDNEMNQRTYSEFPIPNGINKTIKEVPKIKKYATILTV
jgi:hypothetical protein